MKKLPCKECGGQCCTPPAMNARDARRIMRYTTFKAEELKPDFWMFCDSWDAVGELGPVCPAFNKDENICSVYEFRPGVCRAYGVEKTLPCLYLYPKKAEYFTTARARKMIDKAIKGR